MIIKNKFVQAGFLACMILPAIAGYSVIAMQSAQAQGPEGLGAGLGAGPQGLGPQAQCNIETTHQGNRIFIKATFEADRAGVGHYQFGVGNKAGVNISQGGQFEVARGEHKVLSQVGVSKSPSAYNANLHIIFDNQIAECQEIIK